MRVFVSQPMRGYSEAEIESAREEALQTLAAYLGVPRDELSDIPKASPERVSSLTPVECLGASVKSMARADYVVFAKGWDDARGCRVEHLVAVEYGIPRLEM